MVTVLAFGTFDKFHPGHEFFLRTAKTYGDRLVVVIARDHNVELLKGRRPHDNEQTRQMQVAACSAVDQAILGQSDYSQKERMITQAKPQIICLGYDQASQFQSPDPAITVIRLPAYHPKKYKSSLL